MYFASPAPGQVVVPGRIVAKSQASAKREVERNRTVTTVVDEVEGFTEPYRRVLVACSESGIVATVDVQVGDRVEAGAALATLESNEHRALLELARHNMNAHGRLEAALAEARLRQARFDKLMALNKQGFAHPEELERARMEAEVASANILAHREDLLARTLEVKKIQAQLDHRTIQAPRAGVVLEVLKQPGEFVAPNDPNVVVLVVLDRVLATFSVPQDRTSTLRVGQPMRIRFGSQADPVDGKIDVIAPVIDAESGTLRIQVLIDNADGAIRSGERCLLELSN